MPSTSSSHLQNQFNMKSTHHTASKSDYRNKTHHNIPLQFDTKPVLDVLKKKKGDKGEKLQRFKKKILKYYLIECPCKGGELLVVSAVSIHTLRKQSNRALSPHSQSFSLFSPLAHSSLHSSPQAIRNRTHQFLEKCQSRSSLHFKSG